MRSSRRSSAPTAQAVLVELVGAGLGAGLGAALGGRTLSQRGNVWLAILGAVLSGGAVAVLARVLPDLRVSLLGTLGIAVAVTIFGAVVGYNLRRRR